MLEPRCRRRPTAAGGCAPMADGRHGTRRPGHPPAAARHVLTATAVALSRHDVGLPRPADRGRPGVVDRERRWLRVVTGLLLALIALANLFFAIRLTDGILNGDIALGDPNTLLGIGAGIWVTNVIAFAPWYWDTDGGGTRASWGVRPTGVRPSRDPPHRDGRRGPVSAVRGLPRPVVPTPRRRSAPLTSRRSGAGPSS